MHIQADRALIPSQIPTVRHLTVTVTAPPRKDAARDRPAVNVSFVLDRSGSMDGRKIDIARQAVAHAIHLLDTRDRLAVIVYDDRVDTIAKATAASKDAKTKTLNRLAHINARGSTDLAGGWFRGVDELSASGAMGTPDATSASGPLSRVLLLTDGLANQGIVNHDELRLAAATFRSHGIATSTFGVGADVDEALLAAIASDGGGRFYFIERPDQIPDFLARELGETLEVVVSDAVFEITCGPGVEVTVLNDLPIEARDGRLRVRLGDLIADQEITLAIAITCTPRAPEQEAFVDCRVTDRDAVLYQEPMRVHWRAADTEEDERQPVNEAVLVVVAEVFGQRAHAIALAAQRRGDLDEARGVLRDVSEHLSALAPGNQQVIEIVDRLRHHEVEVSDRSSRD